MNLARTAAAGALLLAGLLAGAAVATTRDLPALYVNFTAAHTFQVALTDGTVVGTTSGAPTTIPAGTYQLFLNDTSGSVMDLDLSGPGVSLVTDMTHAEDLAASYTETFQASSTYTYRDDYQQNGPVWTFATSSTVLPSSPTTTATTATGTSTARTTTSSDIVGSGSQAAPLRGTLRGAVSAVGKLRLSTASGRPVSLLRAGRYRVIVDDASPKAGFTLQEAREPAHVLTQPGFTGEKTVTLNLLRGQWFYYSTLVGAKTYFAVGA